MLDTKDILTEERKKRGYTQEDVAKYLNIARGSYAKYETGTNTPTTENIIKLADLYSLSTDYLLGRNNKINKPMKIGCFNCEFNIPNDKGEMICAGRNNEYGTPTPIKNVDYNECWKIDLSTFIEHQKKIEK